jgi:hypothetical protein
MRSAISSENQIVELRHFPKPWVHSATAFVAPHQAQNAAIAIASTSAPMTQWINQMQVHDRAPLLTARQQLGEGNGEIIGCPST